MNEEQGRQRRPWVTRPQATRRRKEQQDNGFLAWMSVLMVTAEAQQSNLVEAIKAGVSNYIVKPFTAETIKEKLDKIFA